jgi:hypothetical protein
MYIYCLGVEFRKELYLFLIGIILPIDLERIAVVAVHSVLRSEPQKSLRILQGGEDIVLRQTVIDGDMTERGVLRGEENRYE